MTVFFEFEADFVDSLRCIPMQVRYKLDTCGIKLRLSDWYQITQAEREALVILPCSTDTEVQAYQKYLQELILERTGTPVATLPIDSYPQWLDAHNLPVQCTRKGSRN